MVNSQYRLVPSAPDEDAAEGRMGFLDHLDELRRRLIRACIALGAGMLIAFVFVDRIADFVLAPTLRTLPPGTDLIATKPGETFSFYLNVALIGGVVLSAPFVMYQVWRFIAPGLYTRGGVRRPEAAPGARRHRFRSGTPTPPFLTAAVLPSPQEAR